MSKSSLQKRQREYEEDVWNTPSSKITKRPKLPYVKTDKTGNPYVDRELARKYEERRKMGSTAIEQVFNTYYRKENEALTRRFKYQLDRWKKTENVLKLANQTATSTLQLRGEDLAQRNALVHEIYIKYPQVRREFQQELDFVDLIRQDEEQLLNEIETEEDLTETDEEPTLLVSDNE